MLSFVYLWLSLVLCCQNVLDSRLGSPGFIWSLKIWESLGKLRYHFPDLEVGEIYDFFGQGLGKLGNCIIMVNR